MENKSNRLAERLKELVGPVHFRSDYENASRSPEELLEMGRHNIKELEKLESLDDETRERIEKLTWMLVSGELQREALVQYGVADEDAIRKVLESLYNEPSNQVFCDRIAQLSEQGMADDDLTEEQRAKISQYFRLLPQIHIEVIAEEVGKYQNIPLESSASITERLRDLMQEVQHGEH